MPDQENNSMPNALSFVYGTNIWSHYQASIANEFATKLGPDRFKMALFEELHEERRNLGWSEFKGLPWVIGPAQGSEDRERLYRECINADVMVFGQCPTEILKARTEAGKLTLLSAERLLKKPLHRLRMLNPRYASGFARYRALVNHPQVHALTIGHYAADDLRTLGAFGERIWRWGYFAEISQSPPGSKQQGPLKVLWVGRMLDWKRVDTLLRALALIQHRPVFGSCLIVGDGPEADRLKKLSERLRLDPSCVRFLAPITHSEVRNLMREADVYVLPSGRHEGWGVVANEAMSEGCVLVANEQAGAAQDLIADGETGFLFRDGDARQLAAIMERIAQDYDLRMNIRRKAYTLMLNVWSPRIAATRLIQLASSLVSGVPAPDYTDGPCGRMSRSSNR